MNDLTDRIHSISEILQEESVISKRNNVPLTQTNPSGKHLQRWDKPIETKTEDKLNKLSTKQQSETTIQEITTLSSWQNIKSKRTATVFLI